MDFDLTEEQVQLQKTVREFAEKELAIDAKQRDEEERFPTGS